MSEYWPFGPKDDSYREYEKLLFIKENLKDYAVEAVDSYSVAVGQLLRWVHLAIETRTDDIRIRRGQIALSKTLREEAKAKETERLTKREKACEESKVSFDEKIKAEFEARKAEDPEAAEDDLPEFDPDDFFAKFDDENLPNDIPDEVGDDVDNDCNIVIEAKVVPTEE